MWSGTGQMKQMNGEKFGEIVELTLWLLQASVHGGLRCQRLLRNGGFSLSRAEIRIHQLARRPSGCGLRGVNSMTTKKKTKQKASPATKCSDSIVCCARAGGRLMINVIN